MRKLFVSYARENKPHVDQLVEHLRTMGYDTWVDAALRGGQDWWDEILDRIAGTDVVIAIYSSAVVNSTACGREFEWATALGKPVVPVAVEPPPSALPRRFARRQIIDYSQPAQRDRAALQLQGALAAVPPAPALPDPLPEPPAAPLSYLTDLIDLITQAGPLDHEQQHLILRQLEPALTSSDPLERQGGRDIVERFTRRPDLYADIDRAITRLRKLPSEPPPSLDKVADDPVVTGHGVDWNAEAPAAPLPLAEPAPEASELVGVRTGSSAQRDDDRTTPAASRAPAIGAADTGENRPLLQRLSQRTKISLLAGAAAAAIVVGATVIVPDTSSHQPSQPSQPSQDSKQVLPFTLKQPGGVAVDSTGTVYVTDSDGKKLFKLAPGASTPTEVPFPGLRSPTGVAVDAKGNIFVADTDVRELAAGTTTPVTLPMAGIFGAVAVDASGNVYATTRGVSGEVLMLAAGASQAVVLPFGQLDFAGSVAVDNAGNVYTTSWDYDKTQDFRVLKLPPGASTPIRLPFTFTGPAFDALTGISVAVDLVGNVFVVTSNTAGKSFELPAGATTPTELHFTTAFNQVALAVDNSDNLYVTDVAGHKRVLKLPAH